MDTQTQPVTFLGSQQAHCFIPIRYQVGYNPLITFIVLTTKFSNLVQKKNLPASGTRLFANLFDRNFSFDMI